LIVFDLIKGNIRYIVLCVIPDYLNEPNDSSKRSEVKYLDNFVKEKFSIIKNFGNYLIYKKND